MSHDLSFWSLFIEASLLVKMVMLTLLALSVLSWMYILQKWQHIKATSERAIEFRKIFNSGIDLGSLYGKLTTKENSAKGVEAIFVAGFQDFVKMHNLKKASPDVIVESARRIMKVRLSQEATSLEKNLPFLASVQSISPYIGLFGTVWGIIHAFRQLGMVQQATLSMVAPGIAEALIATAMGLVAAIPAGIAYNRFVNQADLVLRDYEEFADQFLGILQRRIYASSESATTETATDKEVA